MFNLVLCETNGIYPKETTGVSKQDGDKWYSNHTHIHTHTQRHTHIHTLAQKILHPPLDYLQLGCDPILENFDLDLRNGGGGGMDHKIRNQENFREPFVKLNETE